MILKIRNTILFLMICETFSKLSDEFFVGRMKVNYKTEELSADDFLTLSGLQDAQKFRTVLDNVMIPRVVGTPGHRQVYSYIKTTLEQLKWNVSTDEFYDNAPKMGRLLFRNIIATLNPNAERFLVLSCHYDSKYMPDYEFLGAIDSAVSCSMLINLAQVLHNHLRPFRNSELSLMLLFFDGEEAFEKWGPNDSIYGARHLARKWESEKFLDKIDLLILLDLIGAPDPEFYSFFANTEAWHSRLIAIEERLSKIGMLENYTISSVMKQLPNRYFQPNTMRSSFVEDDHIPFLRRNVPILHVIPLPFPAVWHTKDDNFSAIDYVTTENISRIIRLFVIEYLLSFRI